MDWIIIIDDSNCKSQLSGFLKSQQKNIKFSSTLNELRKNHAEIFSELITSNISRNQIILENAKHTNIINIQNIVRFEAAEDKTLSFSKEGLATEYRYPLDELENKITNTSFIRIHDDHLINVQYIKQLNIENENNIELNNGMKLPVNPSKIKEIMHFIDNYY